MTATATPTEAAVPTRLSAGGALVVQHVRLWDYTEEQHVILTALDGPDAPSDSDTPTVVASSEFHYLRVELHHDDLPENAYVKLAQLIGYYWQASLRAPRDEPLGQFGDGRDYVHHDQTSVTFQAPSYVLRTRQPHLAMDRFMQDLGDALREGTPKRKRDGVRLVDGFGFDVPFSVWLDRVEVRNA